VKVVAYLRVSTDRQAEHGFGLPVQESAVRAWCKASGHRLVAVHRDEGVSGSNGVEDRTGLPLALGDLRDCRAEGLVMARLDRLARSLTVQEAVLAKVWQLGGRVFTADAGEVLPDDPTDPMRTAMRQMMGVFAQLDKALIVKRLRDGRAAKRATGAYAGDGSPPFGWQSIDGVLRPVDGEQRVIVRAKVLRASGLSLRSVADVLHEEGHSPRKGQRWAPRSLARVLARSGIIRG
jgi:DNA invertase Pin-like site-specific DNA recombinase